MIQVKETGETVGSYKYIQPVRVMITHNIGGGSKPGDTGDLIAVHRDDSKDFIMTVDRRSAGNKNMYHPTKRTLYVWALQVTVLQRPCVMR